MIGLPAGTVDIWVARQIDRFGDAEQADALLSADEKARLVRLHFEQDRRRFAFRRVMRRRVLSGYLGLPPGSLAFETDASGKPSVAGIENLFFNQSSSGATAVLAVGRVPTIGIDVEQIRPVPELNAIVEHHFAPSERAIMANLDTALKDAAFIRLFTLKESALKADGRGISLGLAHFVFAFEQDCSPRLVSEGGGKPRPWQFREVAIDHEHICMLAIEMDTPRLHILDWH
jgi:4'-phosphopantetheinyl transferase